MIDRSKPEAILDVRYGARFGEMNERYYRHLDTFFGFVGLFGGTSVVVGIAASNPTLSAMSGAVVAACAIVERLVRPVEKALEHCTCKKRFADLDARSAMLSLEDIDSELRRLQMDAPIGISALAIPAFNANLKSNGLENAVVAETIWQRLVNCLA